MSGEKKFLIGIIIFTIVILIGSVFFFNKTSTPSSSTSTSTPVSNEQKKLLKVVSDDYIKGNKSASVTLVEYLDFECEACGAYFPLVKQLANEYQDKVRFVVRYYPIMGHKNGLQSAYAVEASAKQGKYWEMHNILFEDQKTWGEKQKADPTIFEGYAQQIGLDLELYKKDVVSQEVKNRVERDRNSGNKLGIMGTPSFFLDGEKIPNPKSLEDFKSFIDTAIGKVSNNKSGSGSPSTTPAFDDIAK